MTMNFRVAKNALRDILGAQAANRFNVIGFQRQEKSAEEFIGVNRLVEVYFKSESFDRGNGRLNGPTQGDVSIAIELTTSAAAKADLTIFQNPASTEEQLSAALLAMSEASVIADESFDELADAVYQIVMSGVNLDLGLPKGTIANKWISTINKDDPNPRGQLVTLTGSLVFSCRVSEDVPGDDTGKDIATIDTELGIQEDTIQKTGTSVNY